MSTYTNTVKILPTAANAPDDGVNTQDACIFLDASDGRNAYVRWQTGVDAAGLPIFTNSPLTVPGGMVIQGSLNPAGGNINFPAGLVGWTWLFSSAGTIGAGLDPVDPGDVLVCTNDSAGGAGAAADFNIEAFNVYDASQTQIGVSRFATDIETAAGTSAILAISALTMFTRFQTDGTPNIKSLSFEPNTVTDSLTLKTLDPAIAGTDSTPASLNTGIGADDVNNGGDSGRVIVQTGVAGDCTGAAGITGGDAGPVQIIGGAGGQDSGGAGTGGNGGDVEIRAGLGGGGGAPGVNGTVGIVAPCTVAEESFLPSTAGLNFQVIGLNAGTQLSPMTTVQRDAMVVLQGGSLPAGTQIFNTTTLQAEMNKVVPPGAVVWTIGF